MRFRNISSNWMRNDTRKLVNDKRAIAFFSLKNDALPLSR